VHPDTLAWLAEHHCAVSILPTPEAVDEYNRLRLTAPAGGLFHSTC
jgi:hypothetical protein